jgi:hypothetical protein
MKELVLPLISTREGWVFRQLLKLISAVSASLTTWLVAQGVEQNATTAIVAGVATILTGASEFGLSKLASKIATPCLAILACLVLTSCGTAGGEKTFLGITRAGWLATGKAAVVAAAPVALDERAKTAAKNPVKVAP